MSVRHLLPLPPHPEIYDLSPELVRVLDAIRFDESRDPGYEFQWFIREYPRVFRHHVDHAEFRLTSIYQAYQEAHRALSAKSLGDHSFSNVDVHKIYWDFEAYLNALGSALELAARITSTAYPEGAPVSFNKFCSKAPPGPFKDLFVTAQKRWVRRLKEYRDCFVHYTVTDTMLFFVVRTFSDGTELRARIPANPNARDIEAFRWSRRAELLRYALAQWRNLRAFDRALARLIAHSYELRTYPSKTSGLFFIGERQRKPTPAGT